MEPAIRFWLLLVCTAAVGCGIRRADAPQRSSSADHRPRGQHSSQVTLDPDRTREPRRAPSEQLHYNLLQHRDRAEVWYKNTLFADLGTRSGAKYSLGGFATQTGDDLYIEETTAVTIPGATGKLLLPPAADPDARLQLRMRSFRSGKATVYMNGTAVAHPALEGKAFQTIDVSMRDSLRTDNWNVLQLRVPRAGSWQDRRLGIAVDWISVTAGNESVVVPDPSSNAPHTKKGALHLQDDWSLVYSLRVPAHSFFRGQVTGRGTLRLEAWNATTSPKKATLLKQVDAASGGSFGCSLEKFAEKFTRLRLRSSGSIRIHKAAITRAVVAPVREDTEQNASHISAQDSEKPPLAQNVVIFLVDTLRADKLKPFNEKSRVHAPGFEAYANRATLFGAAFSQENWTKPSVATLLSGLYPWQHTATGGDSVLPRTVNLLSEILREEGFHTGAFVANGYVSNKFGFRQGWSSYRNYIREGRRSQARFVAEDVLEWLDRRPKDQPFFLYVHTIDPHVPYIPPPDEIERYDPDPYRGPVDFRRNRLLLEHIKSGRLKINARDRVRLEALYDGEITYHDGHFAAILEGLAARGLADSTATVFTSDHGEEFFDHGSVGHGHSLWNELLHVPLAIHIPRLNNRATHVSAPVGVVDVAPTVLDALGKSSLASLSGRSLLPLMRGESGDAPRPIVSGFLDSTRSIVLDGYKLIQRRLRSSMLFDLKEDPREQNDRTEHMPQISQVMRETLGIVLHDTRKRTSAPKHRRQKTNIDSVTRQQLRNLGYVH